MFKTIAIVAGLGLALTATAEAQTPRKGGTIRMTAPWQELSDGLQHWSGAVTCPAC